MFQKHEPSFICVTSNDDLLHWLCIENMTTIAAKTNTVAIDDRPLVERLVTLVAMQSGHSLTQLKLDDPVTP